MNCINQEHPDYKALLQKTGLNPLILNAKIAAWQENNNTEELPGIDDIKTIQNEDDTIFSTPASLTMNQVMAMPTGEMLQYKLLKETLLSSTGDKIKRLDNYRRNNNKLSINENKDIVKERQALVKLQNDLEKEVSELSKELNKVTTVLAPYIEADLERANKLAKSLDPEDQFHANNIITFISNLAEFNPDKISQFHFQKHPLYTDEEINAGIPEDERQVFLGWANRANAIGEILANKSIETGNQILGNVSNILKLYNGVDINQLKKMPLKDASWIDMSVMDISHGIFSHNGILPQAMEHLLSEQFEISQAKHRANEEKIESLESEVRKELKALKESNPGIFSGPDGLVDFSIFFQKNKRGLFSNGSALIDRYSAEYFSELKRLNTQLRTNIYQARKGGSNKNSLLQVAYNERLKWTRKNEIVFDPTMINSIRSNSKFSMFQAEFNNVTSEQITNHETKIKELIGEEEFNKKSKELEKFLEDYTHTYEQKVADFLQEEGITDPNALSGQAKANLEQFELENNPLILVKSITTGVFPKVVRVNGVIPVFPSQWQKYVSIPSNKNHYDDKFKLIDSNPTLKEFYNVAKDITQYASSVLPSEFQDAISNNSLYYLPKLTKEFLLTTEGSWLYRIIQTAQRMLANLMSVFGTSHQSNISYAYKNFITGEQNYRVNTSFITNNQNKINSIKNIELNKFKILSGINKGLDTIQFSTLNNNAKTFLTNILGEEPKESVNFFKIAEDLAHHQLMMDSSMNLFNILKVYSNTVTQYEARTNALPLINALKKHYSEIKSTAINNIGEGITIGGLGLTDNTGKRNRALTQLESWFNNQVLDNRGQKGQFGIINKDIKHPGIDKVAKKLGKESGFTFFKTLSYEERKIEKEIQEIFKNNPDKVSRVQELMEKKDPLTTDEQSFLNENSGIKSMLYTMNNLGRYYSLSSMLKGTMKFLVAKFLGFNISAAATNFLEGQISNSLTAALGDSFPSANINFITPMDLTAASVMRRSFGESKVPEHIWILDKLLNRYDLIVDVARELQMSSNESVTNSIMSKYLMLPTRKVEKLNQSPLIAAMLKATFLKGIDGTSADLFEAMERFEDNGKFELRLKDNFNTEENRATWLRNFNNLDKNKIEEYNKIFQETKSKITETIRNAHGPYDKLANMQIKDNILGQAYMTMRTWLPRMIYTRFATEQDDVLIGVKGFKGRDRSHTAITAATLGGLTGLLTLGFGGALVAGGVAALVNHIGIMGKGKWGAKSGASLLQELSVMGQLLALKTVGRPINTVMSTISMGRIKRINTHTNSVLVFRDGKFNKEDISNILSGENFSKRDVANFKAIITDISNILLMYSLYFAGQIMFSGDDDEDKKKWHNVMVNRSMQLVEQATAYYNLYSLGKTVDPNNTAIYKWFTNDLARFVKDIADPGDIQGYGPNSGKNKVVASFSKAFIPTIVSNPLSLGMQSQMDRQFLKSPLDQYFWTDEKKAQEEIRDIKAKDKLEMLDDGIDPEEAKGAIREKYGKKNKGQSYEEYLEEIEKLKNN